MVAILSNIIIGSYDYVIKNNLYKGDYTIADFLDNIFKNTYETYMEDLSKKCNVEFPESMYFCPTKFYNDSGNSIDIIGFDLDEIDKLKGDDSNENNEKT